MNGVSARTDYFFEGLLPGLFSVVYLFHSCLLGWGVFNLQLSVYKPDYTVYQKSGANNIRESMIFNLDKY